MVNTSPPADRGGGDLLRPRRSGICLLADGAFEIRQGDCIVHAGACSLHTLRAGDEGLDVLGFGTRAQTEAAYLPRAGVSWLGGSWVEAGSGDHPWEREAAVGEPEVAEVGARPASVVHLDDVDGKYGGTSLPLARTAGADLTGLNWVQLPAGEEGAPPHLHSADEEIFVVLDGAGTLELWPSPQRARAGIAYEETPIRAGHVISRPASSGIAHGFRAGEGGMTFLASNT